MKKLTLLLVSGLVFVSCANLSQTKDQFPPGSVFSRTVANEMYDRGVTNASRLDDIETMIDSQTGTIQFQPSEGAFEDGDKTLLDSAVQPSDLATGTIIPKTGDLDLNDTGAMTISTDPDQEAGYLGQDTDGANVPNDQTIRATDGSGNQWTVGRKLVDLTFPFSTSGAITVWQPWTNETGMTLNITRIFCRSSVDDLGIDIDEFTSISNATILNNIVDVTVDTNGTSIYYKTTSSGSMTDTQVEAQHGLSFDIDAEAEGFITIEGWFDANVD